MINRLFLIGASLLVAACGPRPMAEVEKVEIHTEVGDFGMLVNTIEITVSNPRSIKGLTAADFDLVNNVPGGFMNPATGKVYEEYEDDGIVVSTQNNVLRIEATPFSKAGRREDFRNIIPWELHCTIDSALNVKPDQVAAEHIDVLDDCIKGSFTFAGLTREYMLHLPKDKDGNVIPNVPLMVWQIGGGEYDKDLMTVATANRCLVSLAKEGIPCAALVFALANPNYTYSASLYPEKIELIDRNNALQMAFIDQLIAEGKVDGSKLFCAGASSGGGCTMRFMMQFADRFKAAIPCCAMDPIVPIHKVDEKYPGQYADDVEKVWKGKCVYKWNGTDMQLSTMNIEAFVNLPMYFAHAESDQTCKVASTYAYTEARKRLGAKNDQMIIYSDEDLAKWNVPAMLSHFSWVPLLQDYSEGKPMNWLVKQL
ncbi:MAG: prolyl oligopeptidase family serine peptidase [Bacteroidaceae bacterium]|nr:prolyl oligopeptidase family serine peptidase [Bacteroidaceae bacterium]